MHRRDKRKTAQPTPLSIISRHPAVPPLLRCTRLPAVPSPFGCARYPAAPSLFGRNPIVPLCRPVQKQPAALRYRPVGRRLAALTWAPVRTQARRPTISFLFAYPPLPRRIARRPPPYLLSPCLGTAPFPRCATPFGCTHCLAMPLLLTGSTRCPAIQKSPCCGVPVRIIPAVLPCRMTQRQLHCPRLGTTSFSPLYGPLRMRPTAPLCRRCAEIRLLPDHTPCSKAIPLPAVHPWPENSPRRPAVPPRSGGTAGRRLLFARLISRPKRPERVVFFFCQAGFSMETQKDDTFLFSNGQR